MARTDTVDVAPGSLADPGVTRVRTVRTVGRGITRLAGIVPFAVYISLGLLIPMIAIAVGAFKNPNTGAFTFSNVDIATHGVYLTGIRQSVILSVLASVIPGIFGALVAYAIFTAKRASLLRQVVITASGVFANFGGVPLAFLFIASFGSSALVTGWLNDIGLNIYNDGFSLYTLSGVALVYMYFQIPLMVLVILPALEGLRPAWREAAENLGARTWQYWRYVGGPVLMPSFLGCVLLLFGSALSAYATAEALTAGTIPLTSIQIASFLNGNVIAGQENVGKALGLGMVIIIAIVMVFYVLLQRRAAKWLR
ncbi:ABC transporter permease subunit [Trebonia sp.]|uniref:ABC transporter permease n=1 Tax=Trebonia sp. TaxID=2767075 RepID=UPI002607D0B0|nr:ABC transporter permease subunit [Trebonia sp.]